MKLQEKRQLKNLELQLLPFRRLILNWLDSEWRIYPGKHREALNFRNHLKTQVKKGMHPDE